MFTLAFTLLLLGDMVVVTAQHTTPLPGMYQDSGLKSVNVRDTVTLRCFFADDTLEICYWYKQILGNKHLRISSALKIDKKSTFYNEFNGNPRFTTQSDKGTFHLLISDLKLSDSATYYCVCGGSYNMKFGEGIVLNVKRPGSNKIIVQQLVTELVQPGDSVTLTCTIHTETCAGEHSVYWFRGSSEESHPRIIYTQGDRCDQCEKSPKAGSATQSCVYHLPKNNVRLSDAGTYYCAVASCGAMLFGNGTKLNIEERRPEPLLYCLGTASVVFFIIIIVLVYVVFKMNKRKCPHCNGPVSQTRTSISHADRGNQDAENLHYAALDIKKNKPRRPRANTETDTVVYSGIRLQN